MKTRGNSFRADSRGYSAFRRRRVSKYRPHQNTRQRARYARQIAAGQLNMEISA